MRKKSEMKWIAFTHCISQNDLRVVYGRVIEMKTGSSVDFDLASMVRIYFVCLNSYARFILCHYDFLLIKRCILIVTFRKAECAVSLKLLEKATSSASYKS